jgi:hypothetical protein
MGFLLSGWLATTSFAPSKPFFAFSAMAATAQWRP